MTTSTLTPQTPTSWDTYLRAPDVAEGVDAVLVDRIAGEVESLWMRRAADEVSAGMGLLVTGDATMATRTTAAGVRRAWHSRTARRHDIAAPLWIEIPPGTTARTVVDVIADALDIPVTRPRYQRTDLLEAFLDQRRPLALVLHGIEDLAQPRGERHDLAFHLGLAVKCWRVPIVFIDPNPRRHLLGPGNMFRDAMSVYLHQITVPATDEAA